MARVLILRSSENRSLHGDLSTAFPAIDWVDIAMPFLTGRGESEKERRQLLETLQALIAPYQGWDAVFYARAYGAFSQPGRQALQQAMDGPMITAPGAVLQYCMANQWESLFIFTPYGQARHDFEVQWAESQGLAVAASLCLGYDAGAEIGKLTPDDLIPGILAGNRSPADGIYLACTITRSVPFGAPLHANATKPFISATEAMLWELQQRLGGILQ